MSSSSMRRSAYEASTWPVDAAGDALDQVEQLVDLHVRDGLDAGADLLVRLVQGLLGPVEVDERVPEVEEDGADGLAWQQMLPCAAWPS